MNLLKEFFTDMKQRVSGGKKKMVKKTWDEALEYALNEIREQNINGAEIRAVMDDTGIITNVQVIPFKNEQVTQVVAVEDRIKEFKQQVAKQMSAAEPQQTPPTERSEAKLSDTLNELEQEARPEPQQPQQESFKDKKARIERELKEVMEQEQKQGNKRS